MKYRKKPVVIEAFQMTEERRWMNITNLWQMQPLKPIDRLRHDGRK